MAAQRKSRETHQYMSVYPSGGRRRGSGQSGGAAGGEREADGRMERGNIDNHGRQTASA